jgi:catechol 2,3-dioxygenase-like lactoylglutathione lyase family enzyme
VPFPFPVSVPFTPGLTMNNVIDRLLSGYESGAVSRRELILTLAGLTAAAGTTAAQSRAAPMRVAGLNHVTVFVEDVARSVDFYQRIFEMPVQSRQATGTNLSAGSGTQFLGIFQARNTAPRIDHFCLAVEDFDVALTVEALRGQGVEPRVRMREDEVPEIYFNDLDGLSVQLQDARYCGGGGALGDRCEVAP